MIEKKVLVTVANAAGPVGTVSTNGTPALSQLFLREGDHVSILMKDGRVHIEVSKEVK